jgi:hypothetical protein
LQSHLTGCISSDVDYAAKSWTCPFCYRRNHLPPHYSVITETNLPIELIPYITTLEYLLPRAVALPPVFLFVIDTALPAQDLDPLKDTLLLSLGLIPQNALVGLITFGSTVCNRFQFIQQEIQTTNNQKKSSKIDITIYLDFFPIFF